MKLYLCCQRLKRDNRNTFFSVHFYADGFSTEGEGPSELEEKIMKLATPYASIRIII
jgi:hypothetical protein